LSDTIIRLASKPSNVNLIQKFGLLAVELIEKVLKTFYEATKEAWE